MRFDELDQQMRVFETAHDHCVLPGLWMVARLDGRNFTRLTKEQCDFEVPFDVGFRNYMVAVTRYLVEHSGFGILYGYTESDEISLLFSLDDLTFGRKLRKINSVLAGIASAKMSLSLASMATFDCRVSQLPDVQQVIDYFRWRQEDAYRNSLYSHCYWALRKAGDTARAATKKLLGRTVADKNELLFRHGINYNDLPAWQKRGCGVFWKTHEESMINHHTKEPTQVTRRHIEVDYELPMKDEYSAYIEKVLCIDN